MKTINRQTASIGPTPNQLVSLSAVVRSLWDAEPHGDTNRRESLCVELSSLESDLERLHIRAAIGELQPEDLGELRQYAERLARLERRWRPGELHPHRPEGARL